MNLAIFKERRVQLVLLLVLLALLSIFVVAKLPIVEQLSTGLVDELNKKQSTVTALTAATAATSVGVGMIPGAEAVSTNIADLGDYLLLVLGAIWLQKYLVSMAGFVTFKLLYPLSALIFAGGLFWEKLSWKQLATKLFLFGTLFFALVPTSVGISQHIESIHDVSVQASIQEAENITKETKKEAKKNQSWLESLVNGAQEWTENALTAMAKLTEKAKVVFSNMVDAVAVLIITNCIIPLLVFLFFIWVINLIFGLNITISLPKTNPFKRKTSRIQESN